MRRRLFRRCLLIAAATVLMSGSIAEAADGMAADHEPGVLSEVEITGKGPGRSVTGYQAPEWFNPLHGYPGTVPPGSVPYDIGFAGTLRITDPVTGQSALTYCIDLRTDTDDGVHYRAGAWDEANVPHLGYVEYILRHYFPATHEPERLSEDKRAAAVQAAIWYFSDNYVVSIANPLRRVVEEIVESALRHGPSPEPRAPKVEVTPSELPAPSGELVGPFTVRADGPARIRLFGVEVFTDAAGKHRITDGAEVRPGQRLWAYSLSPEQPQGFLVERVVKGLVGTVYLYDGSNPNLEKAQKIILAQPIKVVAKGGATLKPFDAGRLEVVKRIKGNGAGRQGQIKINVDCVYPTFKRTITIPAGAKAGDRTFLLKGIVAGSTCKVTETATGANNRAKLVGTPTIVPSQVKIEPCKTHRITVTDTFRKVVHRHRHRDHGGRRHREHREFEVAG
jgi:TQXA domain-containing protein